MSNQAPLVLAQAKRLRSLEFVILAANLFLFQQSGFPILLQRSGNEPILRFDSLKLSRGAVHLVSGPLQPLSPLLIETSSRLLQIYRGSETQLQRCRLQDLKDAFCDELVEVSTDDSLAKWFSQVLRRPCTLVTQAIRTAAVRDHQPLPASAAVGHATEQRRSAS